MDNPSAFLWQPQTFPNSHYPSKTSHATSEGSSDGHRKVGGIFMVLEKITEDRREGENEWERERESQACECLWEGKGARGEENQTHPGLFIRHRSHHRCSHRHSVWVVGRGVWRASMAWNWIFFLSFFFFWTVCACIVICRPAYCVNADLSAGVIFKSTHSESWSCIEVMKIAVWCYMVCFTAHTLYITVHM